MQISEFIVVIMNRFTTYIELHILIRFTMYHCWFIYFPFHASSLFLSSKHPEAATRGVLYESCSQKFCKFHRKTPVLETPTQRFSCEFCEIFKNSFRTEHFRTTTSENCFLIFSDGVKRDQ